MTRITLIGERTRPACWFESLAVASRPLQRRRRRKKSSPLRKRDKAGHASSRDPVPRKKADSIGLGLSFPLALKSES
jgi:hypothetical protein